MALLLTKHIKEIKLSVEKKETGFKETPPGWIEKKWKE
jgi:hypothetical protein